MAVHQILKLPLDVLLMVLEHMNDLSTLSRTIEAYPTILAPLVNPRLSRLVSRVFHNSWPEELCQYAYAILLAEEEPPKNLPDLKVFMANLLASSERGVLPTTLPHTLQTLRRLASLAETIEFFLHFCVNLYLTHFPLEKRMPLSQGECLRIRRALLRFQLYTQLFHQPEATDEIISDRDWEQRPRFEQHFWKRFTSVEAEECKCVYVVLLHALWYMRPFSPSSHQNPNIGANNGRSKQRGLSLLGSVFSGAPLSSLTSSYAERFVEYAFTGLDKVDPHDANFFLPYHDFQNPEPPHSLYQPSEAHRETNFGVKMFRCPMKYHPVKREDDRTPWRLIGYCFWDEERTFSVGAAELVARYY